MIGKQEEWSLIHKHYRLKVRVQQTEIIALSTSMHLVLRMQVYRISDFPVMDYSIIMSYVLYQEASSVVSTR